MVNIVNQSATSIGGFKHYSGLLPATPGDGGSFAQASVRLFAIAATNAAAIFRGDILTFADSTHGVQGGNDILPNIGAPSTQVVIGGGGGSLLGNQSIAPNAARWVPGDTTSVIIGCCVGFGPISLYMAKNGFQYIPASTQAWVYAETDNLIEMYATVPTVPGTAFNLSIASGYDVQANAGFQSTRFGVSGVSINPTAATTSTLPLRSLGSGYQIGNDPTAAGFVGKFMFNGSRHYKGGAGFVAD